jgi:hypothetical protein
MHKEVGLCALLQGRLSVAAPHILFADDTGSLLPSAFVVAGRLHGEALAAIADALAADAVLSAYAQMDGCCARCTKSQCRRLPRPVRPVDPACQQSRLSARGSTRSSRNWRPGAASRRWRGASPSTSAPTRISSTPAPHRRSAQRLPCGEHPRRHGHRRSASDRHLGLRGGADRRPADGPCQGASTATHGLMAPGVRPCSMATASWRIRRGKSGRRSTACTTPSHSGAGWRCPATSHNCRRWRLPSIGRRRPEQGAVVQVGRGRWLSGA